MAANIDSNIINWSTTAASNQPDGSDTNDILSDLRQIQAVARKYLQNTETIASGSTVDLSTIGGPNNTVTHSTGTTAITSFGTLAAGPIRFVRFSVSGGTLTITHNATSMKLPGSANVTVSDGDCLIAETLGSGNWKVHAYLKADGSVVGTVAVANGGTGATTASGARTNLGVSDLTYRSTSTQVIAPTTDCSTGDGKAYFTIPTGVGGANLVAVHARVVTAGTTGTMDIQIHNVTKAQDMLSTKITIDSTETGSETAATAAVINTSTDDVSTNDLIRIDIDAVHTTAAKGLIVTLTFQAP